MHIDDRFLREEDSVFCYHPINMFQFGRYAHSALYCAYHAEDRDRRLDTLAQTMPELATAIECVRAMGLFEDCAEIKLLRMLMESAAEEKLQDFRKKSPVVAQALRGRDQYLKELYFSFILPAAAAIDADEIEIAIRIFRAGMERLWEETNGQS